MLTIICGQLGCFIGVCILMINQIPLKLLIHSIDYEHYAGNDGWDDTWESPIKINNVRVEPVSQIKRSSNAEGEQVSHVVVVDKVNSSAFPDFTIKSRITFSGAPREVVDVKPFYGFESTPHHYEIEVR